MSTITPPPASLLGLFGRCVSCWSRFRSIRLHTSSSLHGSNHDSCTMWVTPRARRNPIMSALKRPTKAAVVSNSGLDARVMDSSTHMSTTRICERCTSALMGCGCCWAGRCQSFSTKRRATNTWSAARHPRKHRCRPAHAALAVRPAAAPDGTASGTTQAAAAHLGGDRLRSAECTA